MSLETIKSQLGLGARSNKFRVDINVDGFGDVDILANATSLPDVTLGTVEVWDKGRKILLAGEAQYTNTWDVTFYNTEKLDLRNGFIRMIDKIDSYKTEKKGVETNAEYMQDFVVSQLDSKNNVTASYTFHNAFPTVVSTVDLSSESADQISTFTVTFSYSHWEPTKA